MSTSAWQTIAEISQVDLDAYAETFGVTREIIELSLDHLPGVEVLETRGRFAEVKTFIRFYPHHSFLFTSLSAEVIRRTQ